MNQEQMESKITLMILSEIKTAKLIYTHTEISINLPRLIAFTPYQKVNEAQEKAKEIVKTYYNTKLKEIDE